MRHLENKLSSHWFRCCFINLKHRLRQGHMTTKSFKNVKLLDFMTTTVLNLHNLFIQRVYLAIESVSNLLSLMRMLEK